VSHCQFYENHLFFFPTKLRVPPPRTSSSSWRRTTPRRTAPTTSSLPSTRPPPSTPLTLCVRRRRPLLLSRRGQSLPIAPPIPHPLVPKEVVVKIEIFLSISHGGGGGGTAELKWRRWLEEIHSRWRWSSNRVLVLHRPSLSSKWGFFIRPSLSSKWWRRRRSNCVVLLQKLEADKREGVYVVDGEGNLDGLTTLGDPGSPSSSTSCRCTSMASSPCRMFCLLQSFSTPTP
jgi:hypothetical protein